MSVQVVPLQQHLGVFSFMVIDLHGPMHGSQVVVRAFQKDWYERRRVESSDFDHHSDASFKHVLSEVGIVHNFGKQVTQEVVEAVWQHLLEIRANSSDPSIFVDHVTTGFDSGSAWVRSNVATMAMPVVTYVDIDEATMADIGFIKPVSLAARHRDCAVN